jgi:hypothetical protein
VNASTLLAITSYQSTRHRNALEHSQHAPQRGGPTKTSSATKFSTIINSARIPGDPGLKFSKK